MALRLKLQHFPFPFRTYKFRFYDSLFLCMQVLTISTFSSLRPPPFLFHTLSLPRIEYLARDQVSHRSQNSGFGSFYETWLLNVDSDGSECDSQGIRTKLGHNKNGQHLFHLFQLDIVINVWYRVLNVDEQQFFMFDNFALYVCGERVNPLKKKSSFHFAWLFCPSQTLTDSDTFYMNYLRIKSVHPTTCI